MKLLFQQPAKLSWNACDGYNGRALRSRLIGKPPDSGSGDCRFESYLLSQWSHRLAVRTPASHVGNTGSIPVGTTNITLSTLSREPSRLLKSLSKARGVLAVEKGSQGRQNFFPQ